MAQQITTLTSLDLDLPHPTPVKFQEELSITTQETACSLSHLPLQSLVLSSQSLDNYTMKIDRRPIEKRLSLKNHYEQKKQSEIQISKISEMNIDDSREISQNDLEEYEYQDQLEDMENRIMSFLDSKGIRQSEPDPKGNYFNQKKMRLSVEYRLSINSSTKKQRKDSQNSCDSFDDNINTSLDQSLQNSEQPSNPNENSLPVPSLKDMRLKKQKSATVIEEKNQQQQNINATSPPAFSLSSSSLIKRRKTMNAFFNNSQKKDSCNIEQN